ncbi:MAG: CBS domain-containing protein [Campylobacterota bacterium]|nr:CBS domain-containing protein [Campylobacterota bacterium]
MFIKNFIKKVQDTIDKNATIQDAVNIMSKNKLHHIIIIDNKKPLGIITEKDIVKLYKNNINFNALAIKYAKKEIISLHSTRLLQYALAIMVDNNIRKIVVVNTKNEYLGCIEQEDLMYRFEEELHTQETNIEDLLNTKEEALVIDQNESLQYAVDMMSVYGATSILISIDRRVNGIISESDIVKLAQKNIDHSLKVKEFMHSPIITINQLNSASNMIAMMKENNIRRVVVHYDKNNTYYVLDSKDIVNNLKGNYTKFLESKLFDTRDTFNVLSESIIEIIDLDDEQVIYWTNSITKHSFDINIDDNITEIIPKKLWNKIHKTLVQEKVIFETINIKDRYFNLKGHYGTILDNNIIKLFLYDITDITNLNNQLIEQNKIQKKLLFEQQKMAQMGEMIGNIAHQFKQPLSTISVANTSIQLKKEYGILDDDTYDELSNSINNNVEYLAVTIDTFKNFLKEKKELRTIILEDRIKTTLNIVTPVLKNNKIKLINNIDYEKQTKISMVLGELDQVIINIINNAKDALIENKIENPNIIIDLTTIDDKIIITIQDNANGIPNTIIDKIFDEYFTTKDLKNGTGLGLYMSRKIITDSLKGELLVENTKKGAKFIITLPLF